MGNTEKFKSTTARARVHEKLTNKTKRHTFTHYELDARGQTITIMVAKK